MRFLVSAIGEDRVAVESVLGFLAPHMSWSPHAQFCPALARSWLDMRTRTELATASTPPQHLSPPTMGRTPSLWRVVLAPQQVEDRRQLTGEHAQQVEHRSFMLMTG